MASSQAQVLHQHRRVLDALAAQQRPQRHLDQRDQHHQRQRRAERDPNASSMRQPGQRRTGGLSQGLLPPAAR
jgi:hypothetical protein